LTAPDIKRGIVICTYSGGAEQLDALLTTLVGCKYPIYIVVNDSTHADVRWICRLQRWGATIIMNPEDSYECGAIQEVLKQTDLDEFIFLQDTFEILDQSIFDMAFEHPTSVSFNPYFECFAGKWRRKALENVEIPKTLTKVDAVITGESKFTALYRMIEKTHVLFPTFVDCDRFEERFGRKNMVIENAYLRKWKGTWSL
jgi:hypothetical protein